MMIDDTLSELARLAIGIGFTVLVIWLCKVWPSKSKERRRD